MYSVTTVKTPIGTRVPTKMFRSEENKKSIYSRDLLSL